MFYRTGHKTLEKKSKTCSKLHDEYIRNYPKPKLDKSYSNQNTQGSNVDLFQTLQNAFLVIHVTLE